MSHVIFYTKDHCPLCDDAKMMLELLMKEYKFDIEERNIHHNEKWLENYHLRIPYVIIGEHTIDGSQMNWNTLEQALQSNELD
ncbi:MULTISPECIES: glutaredoxin family protein [Virgibacillus]|uniref:Glutaredoxin 3 n=2 Tax=Virgibacillus TaxID=84406 RepID=A0A024QAZ3_9BACI|nr:MULTISPECIES: glutaredoxin family protein [Virgibacillus]EQB37407.1 hypothetical protein M948_02360 [Virgibacillus sp. CM-4]MYL40157.1 glutaredoxin family protein [Virgibacillus massiliensis]GGJ61177.1 hypothetical protein GCM10007111_24160 [Virgibacillus kapii]CDQ39096.1 glutaredoxin 3 [Virgibacillus massiliensis]